MTILSTLSIGLDALWHSRFWNALAGAGLILAVTLGVTWLIRRIFDKLSLRFQRKAKRWRYVVVTSLSKPTIYFLALTGIVFAIDQLLFKKARVLVDLWLGSFFTIAFLLFSTWVAIRIINSAQIEYVKSKGPKNLDKTTVYAITKLSRIIVVVLAGLLILQALDIGISGLLAFGGIGGAAIAFASKDLLANFFGGIIVYFDKPFAIGDWIRSPDRNIEGTVEYIGWRSCRLRTFDLRPLYIPNSLFTTISIENASRMTHRQINTMVGVRYDDADKIKVIVDSIKTMLQNDSAIDLTQTLVVNFVNFGSSSLDILVYAFTKTIERVAFQQLQQDIYLKIIAIISEHGAQCAFPTTTIDFPGALPS